MSSIENPLSDVPGASLASSENRGAGYEEV